MTRLRNSMRTLAKTEDAPGLTLQDAPVPEPGPGEIRVRVEKTAICGTDLHIWKWDDWARRTVPVPMVVGHEFMGRVDKLGEGAGGRLAVGDRVSGEGHVTCGRCRNCRAGKRHYCRNTEGIGVNRPGAFAEYLVLPELNAFQLPDDVADEIGALFDPFGNAVHTALAQDLVGEDVLITGSGPIGAMAAAVARRAGARHVVVTDVNPARLRLAEQLGATRGVDVASEDLRDVMAELGMHEGFDVGLEMSGAPTALHQMLSAMNHGGQVALLGLLPDGAGIDWDQVIFKSLTLRGIYGRKMFDTWYTMSALVQSGLEIGPVITHRLPAGRYAEGFEALAAGEAGKVMLDWLQ